ncbi:LPXTG cell wall anchor domain-containing protein [Vagococcus salmoninarum]|uniref:Gram-positive cocci surface proteins LPxTG domain-containing protein n=1 Tax=Vagococcus salmoninarum TaxID=2739 RepID=A0A429ZHQ2_9ENTE|nr:LPXTG cell wall anchor domain-containing protein [Vagococcus salmoninarum]RST93199.1 hypothetical protein CBF35_12055 [Vagococcus salmoninarum]
MIRKGQTFFKWLVVILIIGTFANQVAMATDDGGEYGGNAGVGFEGVYVFQSSSEEEIEQPPVEQKPNLPQTGAKQEGLMSMLMALGLLLVGLTIHKFKDKQRLSKSTCI